MKSFICLTVMIEEMCPLEGQVSGGVHKLATGSLL